MLNGLIAGLKVEARSVARRTLFAVVGTVLVLIGFVCASAASWIALADARDPVFAWLILGAVYLVPGIVLLLLSRRAYRARDLRTAAEAGAISQKAGRTSYAAIAVAEAFIVGLASGVRR